MFWFLMLVVAFPFLALGWRVLDTKSAGKALQLDLAKDPDYVVEHGTYGYSVKTKHDRLPASITPSREGEPTNDPDRPAFFDIWVARVKRLSLAKRTSLRITKLAFSANDGGLDIQSGDVAFDRRDFIEGNDVDAIVTVLRSATVRAAVDDVFRADVRAFFVDDNAELVVRLPRFEADAEQARLHLGRIRRLATALEAATPDAHVHRSWSAQDELARRR